MNWLGELFPLGERLLQPVESQALEARAREVDVLLVRGETFRVRFVADK